MVIIGEKTTGRHGAVATTKAQSMNEHLETKEVERKICQQIEYSAKGSCVRVGERV